MDSVNHLNGRSMCTDRDLEEKVQSLLQMSVKFSSKKSKVFFTCKLLPTLKICIRIKIPNRLIAPLTACF